MLTTRFELNVGVNPGYGHANESGAGLVGPVWQEKADEIHAATGIYVGAAISDALTVYKIDWGCPSGGERTAIATGLRNPQFTTDDSAWRAAVVKVATLVADHFKQTTAYLTFNEVDFLYLVK